MKMKKAQMSTSQIFTYILALVVASMILLYGYTAISKMRSQTDTVSILQFKTDLTNAINSISYDFGSVEIKKLNMPTGFNQVCFVDINNVDTKIITEQLIKDSVDSQSKNDIFLLGNGNVEPMQVNGISVESDYKCIDSVSGKVNIQLEATGKSVLISQPKLMLN